MTERTLVTGATGFVGSALCRALTSQDRPVRALHRSTSNLAALEGLPVEPVVGDLLAPESLRAAMQGIDLVFHAAAPSAYWRHPKQVVGVIVDGTRNVIRASLEAEVRKAVITSSLAAMGVPAPNEMLTERHTFNLPPRRFPYGYAKRQAEIESVRLAEGKLHLVIVNPAVVLGPGDRNQISGSLVVETARRRNLIWLEGGMNVIHIEDVVAGHLAAAQKGRSGERYILGAHNLTHRHILTTTAEVAGRPHPKIKLPPGLISPAAAVVDLLRRFVRLPLDGNQIRMSRHYLYCDSSKAQKELALSKPLSFRQAVEDTYAWYVEEG
ncbi:MAG: NAD-dependent epimerase/dehydratase family protein, partial [Anaerolineales bacterium]